MATILPLEENLKYLQGPLPTLSTGPAEGSSVPASGATSPIQTQTQTQSVTQTEVPGGSLLFDPSRANVAEGLISPLSGSTGDISSAVERLGQGFREEAGPAKVYDPSVVEPLLSQAVTTQAPGLMDKARGFLSQQYTGPRGLDPAEVARLGGELGGFEARAEALKSGSGAQATLQSSVPGLTPGQARYEAQKLRQDPTFRQRAQGEVENIRRLNAMLGEEARQAEGVAEERARQASETREKSRAYLERQRGGLGSAFDRARAEAERSNRETERAYDLGKIGNVSALPGSVRSQIESTPVSRMRESARGEFEEIMGRYPGISEFDPLGLVVDRRGRQRYGYPEGADPETNRQLFERQRELESLFGQGGFGEAEGEYRGLYPLYFSGEVGPYTAPPVGGYLSFDPGVSPTRQNISTEAQRNQYNAINDLLGEVERLEAAGEPFRAASIAFDLENYIEDEARALQERTGKVDERQEEWTRQVKDLRNRYKKSKEGGLFGKVMNIGGFYQKYGTGPGSKLGSFMRNLPGSDIALGASGIMGGMSPQQNIPGFQDPRYAPLVSEDAELLTAQDYGYDPRRRRIGG